MVEKVKGFDEKLKEFEYSFIEVRKSYHELPKEVQDLMEMDMSNLFVHVLSSTWGIRNKISNYLSENKIPYDWKFGKETNEFLKVSMEEEKVKSSYRKLIPVIKSLVEENFLSYFSEIQVLRTEDAVYEGYRPILDWYYADDEMLDITEINSLDKKEDIVRKRKILKRYKKHKPMLESILLINCLKEMEGVVGEE